MNKEYLRFMDELDGFMDQHKFTPEERMMVQMHMIFMKYFLDGICKRKAIK